MHRVAQRTHQHGGWHDDQGDAEENHDRRCKPLLSSDLGREVLVQRIERDGQNQGPDHQGQERREDLIAKHDQCQDEAGTDEYVQQPGRVALPQVGINPVVQTHMRLPWLAAEGADAFLARFDANAAAENLCGFGLRSGADLAGDSMFNVPAPSATFSPAVLMSCRPQISPLLLQSCKELARVYS